jgi:hypothetical protein
MKARIEKNTLYLEVPLNEKPEPSSSGKTLLVASSHGTQVLDGVQVAGQTVRLGLNAFIPNPKAPSGNGSKDSK